MILYFFYCRDKLVAGFWPLGSEPLEEKKPGAGAAWKIISGDEATWEKNHEPEPHNFFLPLKRKKKLAIKCIKVARKRKRKISRKFSSQSSMEVFRFNNNMPVLGSFGSSSTIAFSGN